MVRLLYTATLYCAAPFFLLRLVWRGFRNAAYWRRIGERFGFGARIRAERGCVWIHAVSVGEVQAAAPIVKALKNHYPEETIVVTSTTPTGAARIAKAFGGGVVHRYFPFDFPGAMARFLRRVQPRVAIIMETEIWPNLLTLCRVRGVPVVLANVRLSEQSASGYRRFRRLFAPALRGVAGIAVQSGEDARRIASIGAPPEVIDVTGSTKFDVPVLASLREEAAALRRTWGASRGIWIAASTHAGEEESGVSTRSSRCSNAFRARACWYSCRRHPERFKRSRGDCTPARVQRRCCAQAPAGGLHRRRMVFIGDTMGELPLLYAAADVAFVGGTLVEIAAGTTCSSPLHVGLARAVRTARVQLRRHQSAGWWRPAAPRPWSDFRRVSATR